jgi:hypothetical protein
MWKNRCVVGSALLLFLALTCYSAHAAGTGSIPVGTTLPAFKMNAPTDKADQEYLGLKDAEPFTLSQVSGKLVIVDFLSAL